MTTRRETVRALTGIAALPFFRKLGVLDLIEVGRRAHADAELRGPAAPRALTKAEYDIVTDAAERIIPRTATAGATDARVADFIDVMLAEWYDDSERRRFKAGLAELDARARAASGRSFVQTDEKQQTDLLETLDHELQITGESNVSASDPWFAMLKHLTVWGYYTSRVGIEQELGVQVVAGHYDGNAPY